ncbi:Rrf2 family transcriptional regulator [Novosphingobium sp. KCTC 2891]|uniref:RrF2 family transcriptional regulator n=1 Tax=Novosphingobium sp. KCTC 2891 TaxID=2989730 RepID=UPI0022214FF8|nr:Rrf2 family transcriptional regulator [Novosphingobium sp. KCTC 2891]MCW1382225.1 Rrf2 family transcriptional regulator [Novosphingobium sp. KCTC 2891]
MQLTQHTDFGLRLLLVLARADGASISLPRFAAEQGLSYNHVAKVAQALVHEGFVASQRGRGGGVSLARPAAAITVGEVVRALERGMKLADCARCALRDNCGLSGVLAEALEAFLAVLDRHTLADVSAEGVPAFLPWTVIPAPAGGTCATPGD